MRRRFEIPLEPGQYNLFEIDDYLRSIRSSKERQELIKTVGYSSELRRDFERKRHLPYGAVELAVMAEDKRIKELNEIIRKRLVPEQAEKMTPEQLMDFYHELESMAIGLKSLYPEAVQFMIAYGALARKNAAAFRGDYQFSNEYKLMHIACPNPPNPDECVNVDTCTNVNWTVNFNLLVFQNVGVLAYVAVLYGLILVYAIWIAAAVFVIP